MITQYNHRSHSWVCLLCAHLPYGQSERYSKKYKHYDKNIIINHYNMLLMY